MEANPDFPVFKQFKKKHKLFGLGKDRYVEEKQTVNGIDKTIRRALAITPDVANLKTGLKKYLEIINAKSYGSDGEVGGTNGGVNGYFERMVQDNQCFASTAAEFYKEINLLLESIRLSEGELSEASLADVSGKGKYSDLKPGWLFDKALKYSNGDANTAMRLITMCGHDDGFLGNYVYSSKVSDKDQSREIDINAYANAMDMKIKNAQAEILYYEEEMKEVQLLPEGEEKNLKIKNINSEVYGFKDYIERLNAYRIKLISGEVDLKPRHFDSNIDCEEVSKLILVNKSLGEDVTIDPETQAMVKRIQSPNYNLKSKNYHIFAGAGMTCEMIQVGVPKKAAQKIQKTAAWAYRTIRMDDMINDYLVRSKNEKKLYQEYLKNFESGSKNSHKPDEYDFWIYKQRYENDYGLEDLESSGKDLAEVYKEDEKRDRYRAKDDAAVLINKLALGGKPFGLFDIPHTNISLSLKGNPLKQYNKMMKEGKNLSGVHFVKKPSEWTEDRFQKAQHRAMTYLVDWEWTVGQHEAGAKFAAEKCTKVDDSSSPDSVLCPSQGENSKLVNCGESKNGEANEALVDQETILGLESIQNNLIDQILLPTLKFQ